ncbi:hypothetical protein JRQ81_000482 [Phrynocephalus forsythii]|uniref:12S rRNA N(4)-cytidine methyltransferase METTL15 n=1 Tax=Phrynocephalus forsythii TaxID=171643 RepID=A0A9Q0Y6J9_9SAUR|nr:hypothetical protein JRQ81_000482 [Phrynocephalus forsythii]
MQQVLYSRKICKTFLFHSLIKVNPSGLGIWVRKMHTSLINKYGHEEKALHLNDKENLQSNVSSEGRGLLHIPVMVKEVIHFLAPQNGQCFLDMTFGAGGHTTAIMEKATDIKIYALDRDPTAYELAQQLSAAYPQKIQPLLGQFSQAEALLTSAGVQPESLDGVVLDTGCSSMQFDTPERGFSLKRDGPLDMRMDGDRYPDMPTAADVVNALDQQELASILRTYGEEKHARKIASAIVQARSIYPITRTQQLASIIAGALPEASQYARRDLLQRPSHIATKSFQALRIFVNNELHELYAGLKTAEKFLKPGGRLVTLSFHSLEDRIIKRFLRGTDISEKYNLSIKQKIRQARNNFSEEEEESGSLKWECILKKVLTPQEEDIENNPRARSAKLRTATKL